MKKEIIAFAFIGLLNSYAKSTLSDSKARYYKTEELKWKKHYFW